MFLVDYHMHSKYSFDGHEEIQAICEMAINRGMKEIAITDHCDIYTNRPYTFILNCEQLYPQLREAAQKYEGRLKVRVGVELGQPQVNPEAAKRFLEEYSLDFVIGSVHNMERDQDVAEYDFDHLDCAEVYGRYLDWLTVLAESFDYDVMGHVTYPLRYMARAGYRVDVRPFEERIRELYKIIIKRNKGIELNTSGLYQEIQETMPSPEMLKWYRECGGEILTIGSDAHYLKHVGLPIRQGMEIVKQAGFRYITVFENRKPLFVPIEEEGGAV